MVEQEIPLAQEGVGLVQTPETQVSPEGQGPFGHWEEQGEFTEAQVTQTLFWQTLPTEQSEFTVQEPWRVQTPLPVQM